MPVHQRHWSQRKPYAYWGDAGGIWKHHIILCTRIRTCWWKHYLALTFGLLFTAPHTFSSLFFFTWTITVHRGSAGTVSFGCRATCFCSAVTRAYNLPSVGLSLHNTHLFILLSFHSKQSTATHPVVGSVRDFIQKPIQAFFLTHTAASLTLWGLNCHRDDINPKHRQSKYVILALI